MHLKLYRYACTVTTPKSLNEGISDAYRKKQNNKPICQIALENEPSENVKRGDHSAQGCHRPRGVKAARASMSRLLEKPPILRRHGRQDRRGVLEHDKSTVNR